MKRYGLGFSSTNGRYAEFAELRFLGAVSALVLAILFGEWWLLGLGAALYLLSALAEYSPAPLVLMACSVPLVSVIVFCLRLIFYDDFVLAALLYGGISSYLIFDAFQIIKDLKITEQ